MEIKTIVEELCSLKSNNRADYIASFLRQNNIEHNVQKYPHGLNIETIKTGINPNQEIIFFSHYDIFDAQFEGANDNTSSVAVLLTIVKFLYFYEPYYTIRLVFNDNEEIIGGLHFSSFIDMINSIIEKVGSFQYLKNIENKNRIKAIFILELSGIGDSIYVANKSGNINCDDNLNNFLFNISKNIKLDFLEIPISLSDMVSVKTFGLKGTVFGAIPYIEGKNYLENIKKKGVSKESYPHIWKNNHTSLDNSYMIQEKSLSMIYNFIIEAIKNLDKL